MHIFGVVAVYVGSFSQAMSASQGQDGSVSKYYHTQTHQHKQADYFYPLSSSSHHLLHLSHSLLSTYPPGIMECHGSEEVLGDGAIGEASYT